MQLIMATTDDTTHWISNTNKIYSGALGSVREYTTRWRFLFHQVWWKKTSQSLASLFGILVAFMIQTKTWLLGSYNGLWVSAQCTACMF